MTVRRKLMSARRECKADGRREMRGRNGGANRFLEWGLR